MTAKSLSSFFQFVHRFYVMRVLQETEFTLFVLQGLSMKRVLSMNNKVLKMILVGIPRILQSKSQLEM